MMVLVGLVWRLMERGSWSSCLGRLAASSFFGLSSCRLIWLVWTFVEVGNLSLFWSTYWRMKCSLGGSRRLFSSIIWSIGLCSMARRFGEKIGTGDSGLYSWFP